MSTPTYIPLDGRRVRVRIDGDPDRPPVLLLHGIGRSLEDWAPQFHRLARTHRVIALDVPGFGFSDRPRERITLPVLARGVAETLAALGEERRVHVIGNSLGGAVAMQLLALEPARVASLVLVNSAGFGSQVAMALRLLAVPGIGYLATRHTTRLAAEMNERLIFADKSLVTKERIDHAIAIAEQPDPADVMYETARALATGRGVRREWRTELIAAVAKYPRPTLAVWGDLDRVLPAHHLVTARQLLPHAETHLFTGIGHMPQIECPDEFAQLVLTFLAGAATAGSRTTRVGLGRADAPS
ncbi:alpha/beta fold hydrolase [Nocardia sp. NPDC004604]|uniref:alpha/beta fold hydrolase n=1 Tax=Nocardia sp. NPDC004604 TaxID=3157013 RepID=UPI00339E2EB4